MIQRPKRRLLDQACPEPFDCAQDELCRSVRHAIRLNHAQVVSPNCVDAAHDRACAAEIAEHSEKTKRSPSALR